jgi:cysteinyl-tRNA synthetase
VHFGGQDLKFPHHENEMAQSEAYHGCKQWVQYFLHSGHLDIDGLKMSKSLKNFITIREAFAKGYTARQLRMMVLLAAWDRTMNFSADTMEHARNADRAFTEFFHSAKSLLRTVQPGAPEAWGPRERSLRESIAKAQATVHAALLDNFDTPTAVAALLELVRRSNEYIAASSAASPARSLVVARAARYVTRILRVFGLVCEDDIGFGSADASGASREAILAPVLDAWSAFRNSIRAKARELKNADLLALCDAVRDEHMPKLGVRLEDDGVCAWKLTTPEEAMRLVSERKANERAAVLKKAENRRKTAEADLRQWEGFAAEPESVFRTGEFKIPDGPPGTLPTQDSEGKELSKKRRERLVKTYEAACKGHERFVQAVKEDPHFLDALRQRLADATAEVARLKQ